MILISRVLLLQPREFCFWTYSQTQFEFGAAWKTSSFSPSDLLFFDGQRYQKVIFLRRLFLFFFYLTVLLIPSKRTQRPRRKHTKRETSKEKRETSREENKKFRTKKTLHSDLRCSPIPAPSAISRFRPFEAKQHGRTFR